MSISYIHKGVEMNAERAKSEGGKNLPLKSNFKLNPEAAVFLPKKYSIEDTHQSNLLLQPTTVERPQTDKEDVAEKARRKAERKAQFEAERNNQLKNEVATKENHKSKADLKAERRALQEAQRAAKSKTQTSIEKKENITDKKVNQVKVLEPIKDDINVAKTKMKAKKVHFLSHLRQFKWDKPLAKQPPFARSDLHPAMLRLGLKFAAGSICGSNARCLTFLVALEEIIDDYVTPDKKELSRDLDEKLDIQMDFLQECRPISVSMDNAAKFFKRQLTQVKGSDEDLKKSLIAKMKEYVGENISIADKTISALALEKINDGDVILTFAHSSVVNTVLKKAHSEGKRIHVIVVDSRPKLEGIKTVTNLVRHGIECTYTLINALSYTMQKVSKVFLGAHALLANGYVMSRIGTAQVALVAKAYNVPVLVCCETHKFTDKVQIDSFVYNELGNPDDLMENTHHLSNWKDFNCLDVLNLMYDVTPPDLVSAVITELGMLPCTSVPVVLRLKR